MIVGERVTVENKGLVFLKKTTLKKQWFQGHSFSQTSHFFGGFYIYLRKQVKWVIFTFFLGGQKKTTNKYAFIYIYKNGSPPPPGPTSEGGECITYQVWCWMHSKTCSENTVNFSVLCTSYWFCFDDRYSLIRENRKKNKTGFRFSFELCSLQNYTPSAGFVTYTSPKPAWEAKNALFCLECT